MTRTHGIAIGFAVLPAKAGIPSSSARVHSNQPFPVRVGETLLGLVDRLLAQLQHALGGGIHPGGIAGFLLGQSGAEPEPCAVRAQRLFHHDRESAHLGQFRGLPPQGLNGLLVQIADPPPPLYAWVDVAHRIDRDRGGTAGSSPWWFDGFLKHGGQTGGRQHPFTPFQ